MVPTTAMRAISGLMISAAVVAAAGVSRPVTAGSSSSQAQPIILRKATIAVSPRGTIVTLEASARLPPPVVGTLDGPPRLFLDFYGVRPAVPNARTSGSGVARAVRFVLTTEEPPNTRVFIDLQKATPHVIESVQGDQSRLRIVLSAAAGATKGEAAPSPAPSTSPTNPKPPATSRNEEPARKALEPDPSKSSPGDLRSYRTQAVEPLQRLLDLRPLLVSIDRRAAISTESLQLAVEEFRDIRAEVLALDAPRPLRATHDTLLRACALALQAASTRLDAVRTANNTTEWNAASAAAGAIMLIDRSRAELRPETKKQ
jgi:AMIN domain